MSTFVASLRRPYARGMVIGFWTVTALLCLQMSFTAYAQLCVPQVADAFNHLGFPGYFRVELSWAKLLGVVLLLAPVPPRLKEWAYAGVLFDLTGAVASLLASGLVDAGTLAYPITMTGVAVTSWALRPPCRRLGPG